MEIEGVKTVVFGIGGPGCKLLDRLARSVPNSTELVALDTEKARLDALVGRITKVVIGESMHAVCGTVEEVRAAFKGDMPKIGSVLSGTGITIVIVSADDEGGVCIAESLSEFCRDRRILTLVLALYESHSVVARDRIKVLKEKSDGIVLVDDSRNEADNDLASAGAFERISSQSVSLINSIFASASNAGFATLRPDELRKFFHDGLFFILAHGHGGFLDESCKAALSHEISKTERILAIVSSQIELEIEDLKAATQSIENQLGVESIEWIQVQSAAEGIDLLLLCGVRELPEVSVKETQGEIAATDETHPPKWTLAKIESKEVPEKEIGEVPIVSEVAAKPKAIEELEEISMIGEETNAPVKQKVALPETESQTIKESEEEINESDLAAELEEVDKGAEIRVGSDDGKASEQKTLDVTVEVEDIIERQIAQPKVKSPALIGMYKVPSEQPKLPKENPKLLQRDRPMPLEIEPEPEEDTIDDIVNDLTGMPTFKKKGQKKLGDYRDNYNRYV